MLEVSLLGVGTVLRLERDAWSIVRSLRQATNEYVPPSTLDRFMKPSSTPKRPLYSNSKSPPTKGFPIVKCVRARQPSCGRNHGFPTAAVAWLLFVSYSRQDLIKPPPR